jgi:hypothetical protein
LRVRPELEVLKKHHEWYQRDKDPGTDAPRQHDEGEEGERDADPGGQPRSATLTSQVVDPQTDLVVQEFRHCRDPGRSPTPKVSSNRAK